MFREGVKGRRVICECHIMQCLHGIPGDRQVRLWEVSCMGKDSLLVNIPEESARLFSRRITAAVVMQCLSKCPALLFTRTIVSNKHYLTLVTHVTVKTDRANEP